MPEPTSEGERIADGLLPKDQIESRAYEEEHDLPEPGRLDQTDEEQWPEAGNEPTSSP